MDCASIFRASGVIKCDRQSEVGSELEPCSRCPAHEGMDHQMCSEWAQKLIAPSPQLVNGPASDKLHLRSVR